MTWLPIHWSRAAPDAVCDLCAGKPAKWRGWIGNVRYHDACYWGFNWVCEKCRPRSFARWKMRTVMDALLRDEN